MFEFRDIPDAPLTAAQVEGIRRHLSLVFIHEIDPSAGDAAAQAKLNEAHAPPKPQPFTRPPFDMNTPIRC